MRVLILIVLFISCSIQAQLDGGKKFSIKPAETIPLKSPEIIPEEKPVPKKPEKKPEAITMTPEKEPNINMMKTNDFKNPGDQYIDKLNSQFKQKERGLRPEYSKNQYLGEVRMGGKKMKIVYRDHEFPDGDRIRVYINDQIVQYDVTLTGDYAGFDIDLVTGFNKIDFEALNMGDSGPNTAQFIVYDDKGKLVSSKEWYLTTGFRASIIVVKE